MIGSKQPLESFHVLPLLSVWAMGTPLGLCVSSSEFKALGPYFVICEVGECVWGNSSSVFPSPWDLVGSQKRSVSPWEATRREVEQGSV